MTSGERLCKDLYTLFEIVYEAYKDSVTYRIMVNGFSATGVWINAKKNADTDVIKPSDITKFGNHGTMEESLDSFHQLVDDYVKNGRLLCSEGNVEQNRSIVTIYRALLTSEEVLEALRRRAEERSLIATKKAERATEVADKGEEKARLA